MFIFPYYSIIRNIIQVEKCVFEKFLNNDVYLDENGTFVIAGSVFSNRNLCTLGAFFSKRPRSFITVTFNEICIFLMKKNTKHGLSTGNKNFAK